MIPCQVVELWLKYPSGRTERNVVKIACSVDCKKVSFSSRFSVVLPLRYRRVPDPLYCDSISGRKTHVKIRNVLQSTCQAFSSDFLITISTPVEINYLKTNRPTESSNSRVLHTLGFLNLTPEFEAFRTFALRKFGSCHEPSHLPQITLALFLFPFKLLLVFVKPPSISLASWEYLGALSRYFSITSAKKLK